LLSLLSSQLCLPCKLRNERKMWNYIIERININPLTGHPVSAVVAHEVNRRVDHVEGHVQARSVAGLDAVAGSLEKVLDAGPGLANRLSEKYLHVCWSGRTRGKFAFQFSISLIVKNLKYKHTQVWCETATLFMKNLVILVTMNKISFLNVNTDQSRNRRSL
jgi:hypothetical protein